MSTVRNSDETISVPEGMVNRVHHIDCLIGMRELPDNCVDVAIVDPPYNASKGGKWSWEGQVDLPGFGGQWSKVREAWDDSTIEDYFLFTIEWLQEVKRLVRPTGSLWIHGTYHNIGVVNVALQALQVEIINEIVWYKRNSFPNLSGRRLTASHETILWAHTGSSRKREYLFNYEASKVMPLPEDRLKVQGKQMRTVWDIPNNKKAQELAFGKHPTQKPLRLAKRMLGLSASPGHTCLVPFAGAGTECVAARELGLDFVGFEIESSYVKISNARLAALNSEAPLFEARS